MEGEAGGERRPAFWERDKANGSPLLTSLKFGLFLGTISISMFVAPYPIIGSRRPELASVALVLQYGLAIAAPAIVVLRANTYYLLWGTLPLTILATVFLVFAMLWSVATSGPGVIISGAPYISPIAGVIVTVGVVVSTIVSVPKFISLKIRRAKDARTALQPTDPAPEAADVWPPAPRV